MAYIYTASVYRIITGLCRPQASNRRDWEITLSLGGPKVIICEEFVKWELGELAVTTATSSGAARAHSWVWAQKQERLNCSVIALLCSLNPWHVIERGHLKEQEKASVQFVLLLFLCNICMSYFIFSFTRLSMQTGKWRFYWTIHHTVCCVVTASLPRQVLIVNRLRRNEGLTRAGLAPKDFHSPGLKTLNLCLESWVFSKPFQEHVASATDHYHTVSLQCQHANTHPYACTIYYFWSPKQSVDLWPQSWPGGPGLTSVSGCAWGAEGFVG